MIKLIKNYIMNYKPVIYQINDENFCEILYKFIETWYELKITGSIEKYNFGKTFGINISTEINNSLNLLIALSYSLIRGKKKFIYNGFEYIFRLQKLNIGYDENSKFLFILREGEQDFYYGIKYEHFLDKNPPVYRFVKNKSNKEMKYSKDYNLIDFLVYHVCTRASKIGVKGYAIFKNNMEIELQNLFEHKTEFSNFEIYETENVIASFTKELSGIIGINKWQQNDKEITKKVIEIFNWNGWSDNNYRCKL